ncbi:hypothetical protein P153DRAFT_390441 [Dothidotthia symphoricarpi CBS 119687]|uniref:Thioesterase domain-containing protein n=1 Tax=Dothidotthia symphoricarpi CBS 119687 TaxID=1392245 RepID=A0A6A5ZXB1_9PLEO|nr:uncharacterized protein P153DRAFT_390441 [Dothidotthia symphoricarpi CBS 119687]KAF2124402.1 hypothetical protein P153DRAFT_390441 [Dothidotthia symphoricarpi CBS 119687]
MSGAVAPPNKDGAVDKFTMDDERPFDSYIAKYNAEKELKKNPALQAELHGQRTATSSGPNTPKRKRSRVFSPIDVLPHFTYPIFVPKKNLGALGKLFDTISLISTDVNHDFLNKLADYGVFYRAVRSLAPTIIHVSSLLSIVTTEGHGAPGRKRSLRSICSSPSLLSSNIKTVYPMIRFTEPADLGPTTSQLYSTGNSPHVVTKDSFEYFLQLLLNDQQEMIQKVIVLSDRTNNPVHLIPATSGSPPHLNRRVAHPPPPDCPTPIPSVHDNDYHVLSTSNSQLPITRPHYPLYTPTMSVPKREHIEDLTAHEWCQTLLFDPTITRVSKRMIPDERKDVSNSFFTQTLFTDDAVRAYITLYRAAKQGGEAGAGDAVFTSAAPTLDGQGYEGDAARQRERQGPREEKVWDPADPDTAEGITLVSLGEGIDGGVRRLHGGVSATLLDQVMGTLISYVYENTCATSELRVKYLKAVVTPCVLLCRAKIVREVGRWVEVVGWVEDGCGTVFAEAWGAFVLSKAGSSNL